MDEIRDFAAFAVNLMVGRSWRSYSWRLLLDL